MKWRTHEGGGPLQGLQQWSGLMLNGQKFESTVANGPNGNHCPCQSNVLSL